MIKKCFAYLIAIGIGTFVLNVLEKTPMNVWSARGIGALISVIVILILYKKWFNNKK